MSTPVHAHQSPNGSIPLTCMEFRHRHLHPLEDHRQPREGVHRAIIRVQMLPHPTLNSRNSQPTEQHRVPTPLIPPVPHIRSNRNNNSTPKLLVGQVQRVLLVL